MSILNIKNYILCLGLPWGAYKETFIHYGYVAKPRGARKICVILYCTVYPRSSDPFYIAHYIKWSTTSWTDGKHLLTYWTIFCGKE